MKLSIEWVREHVTVEASVAQVADRLTAAGHALESSEEIEGDWVLDLEVTTNRPDAMNVRGLARELGTLYRLPLQDLAPLLRLEESGAQTSDRISIQVHEPELCRRFVARVVTGVQVGPSPEWLASRLRKVGLRPVNNLVDITNYVMMELGHPLHAFDLKTLKGAELHVRRARAGERLVTLEGAERVLEDWMILITDGERPASLAGVMGGRDTEISDATTDVLLEAAWWDPVTIYRTGRALGLSSDASYRFERGADIEACAVALDRCAHLVASIAGGEVAVGALDLYPGRRPARTVEFRPSRASMLLGAPVDEAEARSALEHLGFTVDPAQDGPWTVTVPSHRGDVSLEVDVIEEVGRILGFDRIPEVLPYFPSSEHGRLQEAPACDAVRRVVEAAGYTEALNFSFVSRAEDVRFSAWPEKLASLANPMSVTGEVLRSSLLPLMLRNVTHNLHHGTTRVRLYEIGRVFRAAADAELPEEFLHLGLVAVGARRSPHWSEQDPPPTDVYDLTGVLERIADCLRLPEVDHHPDLGLHSVAGGPAFLESGSAITCRLGGEEVAWLGTLDAEVAGELDLDRPVQVAEVALGRLLGQDRRTPEIRPLPRFPSITRDLSLILPREKTFAQVRSVIRGVDGERITRVTPFDRYAGSELPQDTWGLSVSICFQHPDRTLLSEEVDDSQEKIVEALNRELGARLRT